ncbi:unnamed protein product, partial [Bubo scandiacus]
MLAMAMSPEAGGDRQERAGLPIPGERLAPEPKPLLASAQDVVANPMDDAMLSNGHLPDGAGPGPGDRAA